VGGGFFFALYFYPHLIAHSLPKLRLRESSEFLGTDDFLITLATTTLKNRHGFFNPPGTFHLSGIVLHERIKQSFKTKSIEAYHEYKSNHIRIG